jgi:hypothetical protein
MNNIEKRVIELRKKGYSRNEISAVLHLGHSKVQNILNKYDLSAKKGLDYRKKEYKEIVKKKKRIRVKGKKYKKKRIIYKKKEKKKISRVKKKTGKVKKEKKVRRKYRYFIYAWIKYEGYKGLYLEKGKFGTRYIEYLDNYELAESIKITRDNVFNEIAKICQSLSSLEFQVYYVRVIYDDLIKKVIDKESIDYEYYTCDDVKKLI